MNKYGDWCKCLICGREVQKVVIDNHMTCSVCGGKSIMDIIICKMLIQVDTDKISERAAKKLNLILSHYEMELTEDGWYMGTDEHCKSVFTFITQDENIFNCLTKWIWWDLNTGVREDCIKEHLEFKKKWG